MCPADTMYPEQNPRKKPREPKEKQKPKNQCPNGSQGDWGGRGGGEPPQWDVLCGFSKKYTDETTGKVDHMQYLFFAKSYKCRDLHKGLADNTGKEGIAATVAQYQAVKKKCKEMWPAWTENDIPLFPQSSNRRKGEGKGKGKGKGGKGKGKGW